MTDAEPGASTLGAACGSALGASAGTSWAWATAIVLATNKTAAKKPLMIDCTVFSFNEGL
jgi:hypothetical protein